MSAKRCLYREAAKHQAWERKEMSKPTHVTRTLIMCGRRHTGIIMEQGSPLLRIDTLCFGLTERFRNTWSPAICVVIALKGTHLTYLATSGQWDEKQSFRSQFEDQQVAKNTFKNRQHTKTVPMDGLSTLTCKDVNKSCRTRFKGNLRRPYCLNMVKIVSRWLFTVWVLSFLIFC